MTGWFDALVGCSRDGSARLTARRPSSAFAAKTILAFSEVCKHTLVRVGHLKLDPLWAKGHLGGQVGANRRTLDIDIFGGTAKARSVQQAPESERWDKEFITSCRGLPRSPHEDPDRDHPGAPPLLGPGKIRGSYITKLMVADHGPTTGCAGWLSFPGPHVPRCRDRFAKMYGVRPDAAADGKAAPSTPTTAPVPAVASQSLALTDASVQFAGPKVDIGEQAARAFASRAQIRGASSSTGSAPAANIEIGMNVAELMRMTTRRKANEELTADETTAMLAAIAWEREQEDKPLRLDEGQEVLKHDVEDCAELVFERVDDDDDGSTAASYEGDYVEDCGDVEQSSGPVGMQPGD